MSPRTSSHTIDTAVGRVDAERLEDLREKFDTHRLLAADTHGAYILVGQCYGRYIRVSPVQ